jgi:two-component system, sensor histidine kinase and response regulator
MSGEGRVLIVDDDPALLHALSETLHLRMPAVMVETSESAQAALERLHATEYDAVIADIKMPGMDGLQLLGRIRDLRPETPTLLITGHGEHDLAVQALRGGAHDYVQKPIDRDYFVGSLSHAIEKRKLSQKVNEHKQSLQKHSKELEECLEERTHEVGELYRREALARAELQKSNTELETARRRTTELASVIAHELATPLTTLRGYAELLTRPSVKPALRERARHIIVSETSRMERLVQDLVRDTDQSSVGLSLQIEKCDLAGIVREQVEIASARSKRHRVVLDAPEVLECDCDGARVAQVVANLLDNAIKYTSKGEIQVGLWRAERKAMLRIHDAGPGIPAESLTSIFEPHTRLHAPARRRANQRTPRDAGLGLSIAHDIVEAHGGRIWAESHPGDGSSFCVVLPLQARRRRQAGSRSRGAPRAAAQEPRP